MMLDKLKNTKILILGFGREGKDTFLFLKKKFPHQVIETADQKDGADYLKNIQNYDVIIKSPGISSKLITPLLTKNQILTSQTDMFLANCKSTVIGVTGTKGKSTTSSLIYDVLKKGGLRAHLIGNIGKPVLSFLNNQHLGDVFVYELSSFQLEHIRQSPHIAVFLNLYPEHLDRHATFKAYRLAKANITKYQKGTDVLIYNAKDPLVVSIAKHSKAQKLPFGNSVSKHLETEFPNKTKLSFVVASTEPARIIGRLFSIPEKTIKKAIQEFKPLPHRLEPIGTYRGIAFYNDSLATIPEATILAIDALGLKVHTLISGGFDRGLNMEKLGDRIQKSNIKTLILFPDTGEKILQCIKNPSSLTRKPLLHFFVKDMEEAVKLSYQHTPKKTICLLSPAASSFNMFKDYQDRGEQFIKFVKRYGKNPSTKLRTGKRP